MQSLGALAGLAIGDALGAPLENLPVPQRLITTMGSGGVHGVRRGTITDDTLQAIAIAESLIKCRGFAPEELISRFLEGYHLHPEFYGPTSSAVFELIIKGFTAREAAEIVRREQGGGRSNGCVMRGAPLGIWYAAPEIRAVSIACACLTHADPVACECSAFFNHMISELCRGRSRETAYSHALSACQEEEVRERLTDLHLHPLIPSLDALEATHCATAICITSSSFRDTVVRGVNLGGDADTIGALCGALAGAYWGIDAIPEDWKADLREWEMVVDLAGRLATAARP